MQITLTPDVEAMLEQELSQGRFASPSELIATALRVLADSTPRDLDSLDEMIDEGIADADAGRLHDESEVRAYLQSVRARL